MDQSGILRFDRFRIDGKNEQLWRDSELVEIRPKTFEVLVYLANNSQRLVTRKELFEKLWLGARLSDNLLRAYIWELRQLLGDSADSPKYLETVSRRGYRFLQPVTLEVSEEPVGFRHQRQSLAQDAAVPGLSEGAGEPFTNGHSGQLSSSNQAPRRPAPAHSDPPIVVGVLHSLTGTMAYSESPVVDATLMAIDEINRNRGLLGRRVEAAVVDGRSKGREFARKAEWLLTQKGVGTIFGCWMSAHRRQVVPLVESHDGLLIYPVQYEGLECSPSVFYVGSAPNQQIIPAVRWSFGFLNCKRLFLVGSDYIFPRVANEIIRDQVVRMGGVIVGESYIPPGAVEIGNLAAEIAAAKPDLIVNTINGDSNIVFFRSLHAAGITPDRIPTLSFSIGENELRNLDIAGTYAAWNYFQSIARTENLRFVAAIRARYGPLRVTSDPMEAAYIGVHLWAQAVSEAGSAQPERIREALRHQRFNAPEGPVHIDSDNQHAWKTIRVGKVLDDGQFQVVYSSENPIRPEPYPDTRSAQEWKEFLKHVPQATA
jgi:urea transport system substrate-binding protein